MKAASLPSRGLSLIELLVALAIFGFAMVAAMPSIRDWIQDMAVRSAGEALKAGLERARIEALRRNATVGFWLVSDAAKTLTNDCVLSDAGPSWVVSGANPESACASAVSTTVAPRLADRWSASQTARGATLVTLTTGGGTGNRVQFDSIGQVIVGDEQVRRIDISHESGEGRVLRILVEPGGAVRLCEPAVVSATDPRRC